MRALTPPRIARVQSTAFLVGIGASVCLLAVVAGAAAATSRGALVAGAMLGLAACGIGIAVYVRDPIRALIWLWLLVVFNAPISTLAGYNSSVGQQIRQVDEVFVLLLVGLTAWLTLRTNRRIPWRFILPGLAVVLFGLLGAVLHHVPLGVSVPGAWLGLKFWIMIGVALLLPWKYKDISRVYTAMTGVGLLIAGLGFAEFLTHGAVMRALHLETFSVQAGSFRASAVHSIFFHPNEYSLFMSMLFAITFARFAGTRRRSDLMLALTFAAAVVLSLRLKGFLSLATVVIIVALAQEAVSNQRTLSTALVGVLLLVGVYLAEASVISSQTSIYTTTSTTAPRAKLYAVGEEIASDNFPLGVGFGRFASYLSRTHYSPVYGQYGLDSVWGLSRAFPSFIDDTSWPSVIGEVGYAGLAAYAVGLFLLLLGLVRRLRTVEGEMKWVPLAAICALGVILIDSLGDPTLFDWVPTTTFALILGLATIGTEPSHNVQSE